MNFFFNLFIQFDVWNGIRGLGENIDVRLSPESYLKYKKVFDILEIDYTVKNEDIQTAIDLETWQNSPYGFGKFTSISNNSKYLNYQQV